MITSNHEAAMRYILPAPHPKSKKGGALLQNVRRSACPRQREMATRARLRPSAHQPTACGGAAPAGDACHVEMRQRLPSVSPRLRGKHIFNHRARKGQFCQPTTEWEILTAVFRLAEANPLAHACVGNTKYSVLLTLPPPISPRSRGKYDHNSGAFYVEYR